MSDRVRDGQAEAAAARRRQPRRARYPLGAIGLVGLPIAPGTTAMMPVYNAVMHETRKFLESHGVPEPYTTAGEFVATALVDAAAGNVPGSAFRPPRDRAG